ncbi:hypothetical protein CCUS01_15298 [Colletotrichum cuscutae]|uniref:Uncharacterized protein n=1 Tax=Colletotrichum cuscutae TaxID=1209917 RepID=A0AAI9VHB2_9PEZI|nr:hypothetical protein CCUS01_15298 [Colletotrichum cuscutae]
MNLSPESAAFSTNNLDTAYVGKWKDLEGDRIVTSGLSTPLTPNGGFVGSAQTFSFDIHDQFGYQERVEFCLRYLQLRRAGFTSSFALDRNRKHLSRRLARAEDPDPEPEFDNKIGSDLSEETIYCHADLT